MNTPRTKRRYEFKSDLTNMKSGHFAFGLHNASYAKTFAAIVTEFEHLEMNMSMVLAFLLGMIDEDSAGYVLRAISTTNARIQVMRDLLEKAPVNKATEDKYDEILAAFDAVRGERNGYVHGLWQTSLPSRRVYWLRRAEHGYWFFDLEHLPLSKLKDLLTRIRKLNVRVITEVKIDLIWKRKPQQPVHLPQPVSPTAPKIVARYHPHRSKAKSPPPPPRSSKASPRKKAKKAVAKKRRPVGGNH